MAHENSPYLFQGETVSNAVHKDGPGESARAVCRCR